MLGGGRDDEVDHVEVFAGLGGGVDFAFGEEAAEELGEGGHGAGGGAVVGRCGEEGGVVGPGCKRLC